MKRYTSNSNRSFPKKAAALRLHAFDPKALDRSEHQHERLDHLTINLLAGARRQVMALIFE
jgi:hypothetical protein